MVDMEWSARDLRERLGRAAWIWDDDMGMHVPVCSRWKHDVRKGGLHMCGNGPLVTEEELETGTCSEGPHLPRHERSI